MAPQTTEDLQVSVEQPGAWARKLVITVSAARVKSVRSDTARELAQRVKLRGFRKGKVPPQILESRFGSEIDREARQRLVDTAFREAIEAEDLEPISEPRVANLKYDPESDLTFEVSFEVRPEIQLARVGGFRIERPEVVVNEDEVDERLDMIRRQQALWKPVERKPESGDNVSVEITPLDEEGGEARPYRFVLGEGQAIPGVEEAIKTLEPGAADEFTVPFPDDFPDEEKRGETQRLRIALDSVMEQELPEVDDALAASVGDFETLDELRDAIREDLRGSKKHEVEHAVEHRLIQNIIEANPFEVPKSMVDRYVEAMLGEIPEDADPEAVERARQEARPAALRGIKRTLILQRIAEEQGFEASREEVKERIERLAERTGRSYQEVRSRLAKSGELRDVERTIVNEKVFDFLREQSEIEDGGGD